MKIGIDGRAINVSGGTQTYAINLLKNFKNKSNIIIFGVDNFENYKCINGRFNKKNLIFRLIWDFFELPYLVNKNKIDLFHGLKGYTLKYNNKAIITVTDVHTFIFPNFKKIIDRFYSIFIVPIYYKKSDKIITISKATKNDLIKIVRIPKEKIKVIYLGFDKNKFKLIDKKKCEKEICQFFKKNNLSIKNKKIIFHVSTLNPRKNVTKIILAFNELAKNKKDLILIISGKIGWKTEKIFEEYKKSPFKDRIHFIGFIPDEFIVYFYNISEAFVYPSIYEGFGLPILEAQSCSCPVITSNISSMPEVAGKGAILVNPNDVTEISSAIKKIIESKKMRNYLIKKGFDNCKRFSWERCAKETLKVYEEVYNEK